MHLGMLITQLRHMRVILITLWRVPSSRLTSSVEPARVKLAEFPAAAEDGAIEAAKNAGMSLNAFFRVGICVLAVVVDRIPYVSLYLSIENVLCSLDVAVQDKVTDDDDDEG